MVFVVRKTVLTVFVFAWWLGFSVSAHSQTWTEDLSGGISEAVPSWIAPFAIEQNGDGPASASYEFLPGTAQQGILVSVVFQEVEGGFLRVFWRSGESSCTLSENLYESIGLPNQRSFLLPPELLQKGGIITFQSGSTKLNIHKIRWDWLQQDKILSSENHRDELLGSLGQLFKTADLNGEPATVPEDAWEKTLVTSQITEKAERIEQGVEFPVELLTIPSSVRLECRLNGLELKETLILWVNGKNAGVVFPEIPDLHSLGYQHDKSGHLTYLGWRKAAIWISPEFLVPGTNSLQFSTTKTDEATVKPLALKELKLQLDFASEKNKAPAVNTPQVELVP